MATTPTAGAPTQVRFSARAVVRTLVQVILPGALAAGVVIPQIIQVVLEQAGESMPSALRVWLLAASAGVAGVAAALAKIMALPAVEGFLRSSRFLSWLAAEPTPVPAVDVDPSADPIPGTTLPGYVGRHATDESREG